MNKAEEINKALEFLKSKHNGEIPYMFGSKETAKWMQLYADEQSREKALKFGKHILHKNGSLSVPPQYVEKVYDEWKSNQEGESNEYDEEGRGKELNAKEDSEPETPPSKP